MAITNPLQRAAQQRVASGTGEVTVFDAGHKPSWARGRGHVYAGECRFKVEHRDGVPVLIVTTVEREVAADEVREVVFSIYGAGAIEVLETLRDIEAPATEPRKGV